MISDEIATCDAGFTSSDENANELPCLFDIVCRENKGESIVVEARHVQMLLAF